MRRVLHATVNLEETSTQQGRKSSKSTHGIMFENSISPDFGCGRLGGEMKAGGTSRPCNSATNAALLNATVRRNSRILAKSCNQMLLRRRLRSLSMPPSDPSPSVYLPQTAIARPTRTQAQKCCVRVGSSRAVSGNRSLWKSSDEIQYCTKPTPGSPAEEPLGNNRVQTYETGPGVPPGA